MARLSECMAGKGDGTLDLRSLRFNCALREGEAAGKRLQLLLAGNGGGTSSVSVLADNSQMDVPTLEVRRVALRGALSGLPTTCPTLPVACAPYHRI